VSIPQPLSLLQPLVCFAGGTIDLNAHRVAWGIHFVCILGIPRASKRYFDPSYTFFINIHFSSNFFCLSYYENSFEMTQLSRSFLKNNF
jgi:hypothetical protein